MELFIMTEINNAIQDYLQNEKQIDEQFKKLRTNRDKKARYLENLISTKLEIPAECITVQLDERILIDLHKLK